MPRYNWNIVESGVKCHTLVKSGISQPIKSGISQPIKSGISQPIKYAKKAIW